MMMHEYMDRPTMKQAYKEMAEAEVEVERARKRVKEAMAGDGDVDHAMMKLKEAKEHVAYLQRNL